MNRTICAVTLGAALLPGGALHVARGEPMPPEIARALASLGITLEDTDLARVKEVYNFWRQASGSVWPGVEIEDTPIAFVYPDRADVLIGHPRPPQGAVPFTGLMPVLDKPAVHMPDRSFMHGAGAGPLAGVPTVWINTMDVYEGYVRRVVPEARHYQKPYLFYLGEILHESFHAFQQREARGLPPEDIRPLNLTKIDYPYLDADVGVLLALEGRVLGEILGQDDEDRTRELWRDFSAVRAARHAALQPDLVVLERYQELIEGTAQFVEWRLLYGKHDGVQPLPRSRRDPRFTPYPASDTFGDKIRGRLGLIGSPGMGKYMQYTYYTGMALSYALDSVRPNWRRNMFRTCSGYGSGLDTLLAGVVPSGEGNAQRVAAVGKRYHAQDLRTAFCEEAAVIAQESARKLAAFRGAPGIRYRCVFPGATRKQLRLMGPALISEAGDERLFEAGCQQITRTDDSGGAITVLVFAHAVPVLENLRLATLEIVVPPGVGSGPAIQAGDVQVRGTTTVYSGGVTFDNGVWTWRGDRLEVAKNGVVTVLTFPPITPHDPASPRAQGVMARRRQARPIDPPVSNCAGRPQRRGALGATHRWASHPSHRLPSSRSLDDHSSSLLGLLDELHCPALAQRPALAR